MARIIVVTSGKGGVGKTSIVSNVGCALAKNGHSVCLIDADLGLRNLDVVLGLENRVVFDLQDVIENKCELDQALIKDKKYPNLSILPACKNLDVQKINFDYLKRIINTLDSVYDFIFIDSPAGIERGFFNAINNAKEAIVVSTLNISSLRDADKVIGILNSNSIKDVKLIINKVDPNLIDDKISLDIEDALEVLAIPLLGVVYEDNELIASSNHGFSVLDNKKSNSKDCFENIAKRINGEEVNRAKFKKKGLWARLFG